MPKIGEIIQRVQSLYSKGVQSKDSRLTSRHIYSAMLSARSLLFKQMAGSNKHISHWNYYTIPCVKLVKAKAHECGCIAPKGIVILRSDEKIPAPISSINGELIQSITTLDGSTRFDKVNFENIKFQSGNKYTKNTSKYYIRNGYLFITNSILLKAVPITALWHNPYEAVMFKSDCEDCEECECRDILEIDFQIDIDLIDALVKIASNELIILLSQMKEDTNNDASDEGVSRGTMIHQPND